MPRHCEASAASGRIRLVARTSRSHGAEVKASAHHQAGCVVGDSLRRHSWDFKPFAGLIPITGAPMFPSSRACMPFTDRSPRLIFVADRPSKGALVLKRTGDSEFSARLPGFTSRHRSDRNVFRATLRSILPWALPLAGLRASRGRIRAGSTPLGSSASASLSALYPLMGLTA